MGRGGPLAARTAGQADGGAAAQAVPPLHPGAVLAVSRAAAVLSAAAEPAEAGNFKLTLWDQLF